MRVIRNKTMRPSRVPLPRGKVLHLGAGQKGQIAVNDVDHAPLQELVEKGEIEILSEGSLHEGGAVQETGHVDVHGHHPHSTVKKRGNR